MGRYDGAGWVKMVGEGRWVRRAVGRWVRGWGVVGEWGEDGEV